MRLVLTLLPQGNFSRPEFERKYRCAMHGLIHTWLSQSFFPAVQNIHDSGEPGLFAFSGLSGKFGANGEILGGNAYKISISSPTGHLFFTIATNFKRMHNSKKMLEMGDCCFLISSINEFNLHLQHGDKIVSDGPIILTKGSDDGKKFVLMKGGEINKNNLIAPVLFSSLFKANLKRKAEQMGLGIAEKISEMPALSCVDVRKGDKILTAFTTRMQMKPGMEDYFVVGNRIHMPIQFKEEQELAEFEKLMDCGFGVMNGYGFGFMKKVLK